MACGTPAAGPRPPAGGSFLLARRVGQCSSSFEPSRTSGAASARALEQSFRERARAPGRFVVTTARRHDRACHQDLQLASDLLGVRRACVLGIVCERCRCDAEVRSVRLVNWKVPARGLGRGVDERAAVDSLAMKQLVQRVEDGERAASARCSQPIDLSLQPAGQPACPTAASRTVRRAAPANFTFSG
jgi:hypothetical protein